ncbi:MAG: Calx-beta domain-containing protein [Gammaproteobacteria bacterium]
MLHEEWPDPIGKVEPKGIVGPLGILMGGFLPQKISENHLNLFPAFRKSLATGRDEAKLFPKAVTFNHSIGYREMTIVNIYLVIQRRLIMKTSHSSINGIFDAGSHKRLLNKGKLLLTALALTLSSGASAANGPIFATISNVSVTEPEFTGSATTVNAVFQVKLTRAVGFGQPPVVINFSTVNGSATAPGDYEAKSGSLSFSAGQTSKNITIKVKSDADGAEPTEILGVQLTNASNPLLGVILFDGKGVATITNTPFDDGGDIECPDGNPPLTNGNCAPTLP